MNDLTNCKSLREIFGSAAEPQEADDIETLDDLEFFRGVINGVLLATVFWCACGAAVCWMLA